MTMLAWKRLPGFDGDVSTTDSVSFVCKNYYFGTSDRGVRVTACLDVWEVAGEKADELQTEPIEHDK